MSNNLFSTDNNFNNNNNTNNFNNFNNTNANQPAPFVIRVVVLNPPITLFDVIPFVAMFAIYCIIIHFFLILVKKVHRPSYNALVMFFIIIFPPIIMVILSDYLFIGVWGCLMLFFCYCIRIGFSRGLLARENPKKIYRMFKKIFTFTNLMILLSFICITISKICLNNFMKVSIRFFVYSVYFAVFCREVMFNLSRIMGKTTGFYSSGAIGSTAENQQNCMICCESLSNRKKIFTNSCGHSFHLECAKGWALLASNTSCIYCKRPITDNKQLTKDLWYKTENMMRPTMNFLRSSISFFVVIYLYMMIRLRSG
ncbi:superfamily II DNARNA helicase sNF2 family [Ecytonucleospora hepatopenaei]|uniref:Superfamily II DNARNA helicase sNF2 family n=1 Tax=Ecytonucleospora hepatopenaei TaxID=646526 RepID=A0A1W0E4I2_9MICR|nr:superfamily II DNARNA helicase sNF2 family [Ecytonucleospora hepatopenaei]